MPTRSPHALLVRAADFAARQHRDQRRKNDATPYVNHPLAVARRLAEQGDVDDPVTLTAALLHDTVEDTDATIEQLTERFGDEVAAVVAEVTDDRSLPKVERKRAQIRHAASISVRARAVKLADKLDNLEDLTRSAPVGWSERRVRGYFAWAFAVVAELRGTNAALEAALDGVFASTVTVAGATPFRAVPADDREREQVLRDYLRAIEAADD